MEEEEQARQMEALLKRKEEIRQKKLLKLQARLQAEERARLEVEAKVLTG
jgi:hypothetical protein